MTSMRAIRRGTLPRIADPANAVFLAVGRGGQCVGYFYIRPLRLRDAIGTSTLCLNSLYFLPELPADGAGQAGVCAADGRFAASAALPEVFLRLQLPQSARRRHFTAPWAAWWAQVHGGHADRAEDQMYFEFQTVRKTCPVESFVGKESVKGNRQGVLSRSITRRSGRIAKSCCKI